MCDALGFKGSVVGSGKVDNWSFRWNDVTPTGTVLEYQVYYYTVYSAVPSGASYTNLKL